MIFVFEIIIPYYLIQSIKLLPVVTPILMLP